MKTEELEVLNTLVPMASKIKDQLVEMRRHIHADPELSFEENKTASYVVSKLEELGLAVREKVGDTGVLAEIGEGPVCIGIRADMDALPIEESNSQPYCSKTKGVMHACGHDAHTASALGAAMLLAELNSAEKLKTRFRFIFQPAEEMVNEAGLSGASLMMRDGCLNELQSLIGIHVHPGMPTGTLGFRKGTFLAACDSFQINIKGKGGHGAYPEDCVDAVVLACNFVQSLQTLISRRKSALAPAVLTIGGIRSNTFRPNIVADEVELTGTIRYFEAGLSPFFESEIRRLEAMLEPYGAKLSLKYQHENPALVSDENMTTRVKLAAEQMIGTERVLDLPLELGSEDFSFYTDKIPSVFAIVGCGIEGSPREIHTSTFDIDEDALIYGASILAGGALKLAAQVSKSSY